MLRGPKEYRYRGRRESHRPHDMRHRRGATVRDTSVFEDRRHGRHPRRESRAKHPTGARDRPRGGHTRGATLALPIRLSLLLPLRGVGVGRLRLVRPGGCSSAARSVQHVKVVGGITRGANPGPRARGCHQRSHGGRGDFCRQECVCLRSRGEGQPHPKVLHRLSRMGQRGQGCAKQGRKRRANRGGDAYGWVVSSFLRGTRPFVGEWGWV